MKALLADTGFSAWPLLHALHELGCKTSVIGNKVNDSLTTIADVVVNDDYSDPTILASKYTQAPSHQALIPGCTDASYLSCSKVSGLAATHGIDSHEKSIQIFDKLLFKQTCSRLSLATPKQLPSDVAPNSTASVIVKPVDAYSGRGVTVLCDFSAQDFIDATNIAKRASSKDGVIVEEFVSGQLYSTSAFIKGGEIVQSFLVEEHCVSDTFSVSLSRVISNTPNRNRSVVEDALLKIYRSLKLEDGLLHVQWIETRDNAKLIELTRRCPGDLYARLIELATGYDYARAYVLPFIGQSAGSPVSEGDSNSKLLRITVKSDVQSAFMGLRFGEAARAIEYYPLHSVGKAVDCGERIGILFVELEDQYTELSIEDTWHALTYELIKAQST